MKNASQMMQWGNMPCVRLDAGGYTALIAPDLGSNVIRFRSERDGVEFFRFSPDNTYETLIKSAEVWGLPTLYLPNRFADGVLRTSDAVYHLPVNEKAPYNNHIHGFLHKRRHEVIEHGADANCAWCVTEYVYNENDPFFKHLPIPFRATYRFTVSAQGLEYEFTLTNLSDKQMPISVATHTTINSPFVDGAREADERIQAPVGRRCLLNDRCLPALTNGNEGFADLDIHDLEYRSGNRCPVLRNIDNEMYFAEHLDIKGEPFYGILCEDTASGKTIAYEISENYKFWIFWNDKGYNGYFCPEPMSAMIDAPDLELPPAMTGYQELAPEQEITFRQRFFVKED